MPSFPVPSISSYKFCHMLSLIAKYLYIISYSSNSLAVLVCLVNLLKDVLTHPLSKRYSQEFTSLLEVCKGL